MLGAATGLNFIGNVEGRDIMSADVDVCVTDGFTGNVVLKTLEGALTAIIGALLGAFDSEPQYREHADALMPALLPLYETLSPDTYGGAILLGVDGVCIITHGSSSATAIRNGILLARDMVDHDMVTGIRDAIGASAARTRLPTRASRDTCGTGSDRPRRDLQIVRDRSPTSSRSSRRRSARGSRSSTTSTPTRSR